MIVLVSGSKNYQNRREIEACLKSLRTCGMDMIVTGVEPGPERIALDWAEANCVEACGYHDCLELGPNSRTIRNELMFEENDIDWVILFGVGDEVEELAQMAGQRGIICQRVFA